MTSATTPRLSLAYVAVVLIWATTPLGIEWSDEDAGFLFGVAARMVLGALVAIPVLWLLGMRIAFEPRALMAYAAGSIAIFGGMLTTYWAAQYLQSGMISVLFGTAPFFTSLLAYVLLGERCLNLAWMAGLSIALAGLALIFHDQFSLHGIAGLAVLAMLASALMHAVSTVLVKKINAPGREMLKKSIHGFFQLGASRHMSATASANQRLGSLFALGRPAPNRKR